MVPGLPNVCGGSMPSWDTFIGSFVCYSASQQEIQIDALTGDQLRATLLCMRSAPASGCDSWRVDEFKRLALPYLDRLACLLDIVEQTGVSLVALCESVVS